ncbi:MAG: hypothetical protein HWN51_04535 [Desulfobacterales bacterium]|nr:hypothetical protein [Desulfobacterales bacterium]
MKGDLLVKAIESVTDTWCQQRKHEERGRPEVKARRRKVMHHDYEYSTRVTIKEVAYRCMKQAYMKASAGGTLPAHARQIFYAARPPILAKAHDRQGYTPRLESGYFTQTLLPDYMNEHSTETADWDVVFDARGHLVEPHTKKTVPLGTLGVRRYLHNMTGSSGNDVSCEEVDVGYPTCGPANRFGAILFIEKEGFLPLFEAVKLAERHDIAIMTTKGMSVTAARSLVENVCGSSGIPLLLLRDFDKAGFEIAASFKKDTRRYQFVQPFEVVDLGLRLDDVRTWGLVSEDVFYRADPRFNLFQNGASQEEIHYLCEGGTPKHYHGQRVELNAFTSDDFIKWIESKLDDLGISKIIPDGDTLNDAYTRATKVAVINKAIEAAQEHAEKAAQKNPMPKTLKQMIDKQLKEDPTQPWDKVVAHLAASKMLNTKED